MRRLLLTLVAFGAVAPVARAQPAPPGPRTDRIHELIALSKRKDSPAVVEVADRLVTDRDPMNRRLAARALEKMVDAATDHSARGAAITALVAATHDTDPKVKADAAKVLVTLKNLPPPQAAIPPARPAHALAGVPLVGGAMCITSAPVIVRVENLTQTRFDVCAAFGRASSRVAWPSSLSTSNGFGLRVTLRQLERVRAGQLRCQLSITTSSQQGTLNHVVGGAMVSLDPSSAVDPLAKQDCVDAVLQDMLASKVVAGMQAASAPSAASPSAPGTSGSAPASSTSASRDHATE